MNMSYCRFENTNSDLRDCLKVLKKIGQQEGDEDTNLSSTELSAAVELAATAFEVLQIVAGIVDVEIDLGMPELDTYKVRDGLELAMEAIEDEDYNDDNQ